MKKKIWFGGNLENTISKISDLFEDGFDEVVIRVKNKKSMKLLEKEILEEFDSSFLESNAISFEFY